jgi:deoxyribodipyrimidine photolyase-related protein
MTKLTSTQHAKTHQNNCFIVLGNQLFLYEHFEGHIFDNMLMDIYMSEDFEFCSTLKFHKLRIIFFLSAMREQASMFANKGHKVTYHKLGEIEKKESYTERFVKYCLNNKKNIVHCFEIEDTDFFETFKLSLEKNNITLNVLPSPMFLFTKESFKNYLATVKKPFMKTFYEGQRKKTKILMEHNKPIGGKFSFDEENRLKLPESLTPPLNPKLKPNATTKTIIENVKNDVNFFFQQHPGSASEHWLPTNHEGAEQWFNFFLKERLELFGPYEDSLAPHSDFVYHSSLSSLLNAGLLTPKVVVAKTLDFSKKNNISIASTEGFIRQILGWREFIRGIYNNFGQKQKESNFWKHKNKLSNNWYTGNTGIEPLDLVIKKVLKYGYCHHIERLMVLSNTMLLCEIEPQDCYNWFMEMFIDSSDWVMTPNVFGMGLFSDGGIFATKPYICGSNYWVKMGFKKNLSWSEGVDGLYWRFINQNKNFFLQNPRLSMMPRTLEKITSERKSFIFSEAEKISQRLIQ